MNGVDEISIRDQLDRAVRVLDPAAPALESLRVRAVRRRRTRRAAGGFMVLGVAGAVAAIFATVIAGSPSGTDRVQIASPPTHRSLVQFAKAHGALKIAGPYAGKPGWYGAFTTKRAIVVAEYGRTHWELDGPAVTSLGKGRFVTRLHKGPRLGASKTPSIYVSVIGGDVSYYGSVLRRAGRHWQTANFGGCGNHGLCPTPSNSQPYGHLLAGDRFTSVWNNCTPYCAAGTDYRVNWRWSTPQQKFVALSEHILAL